MSNVDITYSRTSPSPRYRELAQLYGQMHVKKVVNDGGKASDLFQGFSLLPHATTVRSLIMRTGARSVLDYGSGKGLQYQLVAIEGTDGTKFANVVEYWGVDKVACFDPGVPEYSAMPEGIFDGVVSTDVLEHCPEDDLPWIMEEMVGKARRFVFATIAMYPAAKILPNGENAHCTIRSPEWWRVLIDETMQGRPELAYRFELHWFYEGAKVLGGRPPEIVER